ncbi:alpha/beta fold hydrolase [Conexibacter sp. SYSU D00693]|uniref:alpha/beta fold hydrolase n=1 Tax=Conexibacter sp. SYSU D00693 TaxID=2812560 RepID=UPI00196A3EC2|nr:alpha/beta fold hydrolase [Conexibacter sp. SYSU D00693]
MPTIDVNGTTLAYDDRGPRDGVPVLLSHSLFFDRRMFTALAERLGEDLRVVAYDHRGQGESAPAPLEELSMDVLTEDAAALIRALGLAPAHVVGNSMGGFVALRLAARHPDLVRTVTALGSSAEEEHQLAAFAPLVEHLQAHGAADVVDTVLHIMFGDTTLAGEPELCAHWREVIAGLPPAIGDAAHQVIHRERIVEELAGTTVPVLAVAGAEDHAYPQPISGRTIAQATGGREVTVAGAGHSVALEQPDEVAGHLARLFAEHLAPAAT